jgi:hypothetical protein
MLYDTYTDRGRGRPAAAVGRQPVDPEQARMNPWLLWRPEEPLAPQVLTVAETSECVCPDLCNRDHVNE